MIAIAKKIYTFLTDNDFISILDSLSKNNALFFDKNKNQVSEIKATEKGIPTFYIGYNAENCIMFQPCWYSLYYLQCATFYLENEDNDELYKLFKLIKNFIKNNFILSKDKSCYIGKNMYEEWQNKKYLFTTLFFYDKFNVNEDDIKNVFEYVLNKGFIIKTNNTRLKNKDIVDWNADSFVICKNEEDLLTKIINKKSIRYDYGSECVFVQKNNKLKSYEFILDERICKNSSIASFFFELVKNYVK